MKIVVIGGSGFAGRAVVAEAIKRGHEVVAISRSLPEDKLPGVQYVKGSALDVDFRAAQLEGADVVVGAVSPRGDMAGQVHDLYVQLADETARLASRLIVIGGFSSLRPAAGQPRFFESGDVPAEYLAEATEMANTFDTLVSQSPANGKWLFISPAAVFGAHAKLDDTGSYRVGDDVAMFDKNGESQLSAGDFALGVLDEIEQPKHNRANISLVQ